MLYRANKYSYEVASFLAMTIQDFLLLLPKEIGNIQINGNSLPVDL